MAAATEATALLLEQLGHQVEPAAPTVDPTVFQDDLLTLWAVANAHSHDALVRRLGVPERDELELTTWELVEHGRECSAVEAVPGDRSHPRRGPPDIGLLRAIDLWLTPTLAQPPLELGVLNRSMGSAEAWWRMDLDFNPFNPIANLTGSRPPPAAACELGRASHRDMLTARFGREDVLFQVSAQLEQALPWAQRSPAVVSSGIDLPIRRT